MGGRGERSAAERDVARDLRRQLKLAARREGEPLAVQLAGEALAHAAYAKWRRRALRRGAVTGAPVLESGRYALVLFALAPAAADRFVRQGSGAQLAPPTVGAFLEGVEPAVALGGTIAGWLEIHTHPVALAPPLLHIDGRWRVADLGLEWPLAPYAPRRR
jgi:hypothetical protein